MPSFTFELIVVLLLILLNGVLAMSEMAIVSSRKARLEQRANKGDRRARVALELANDPNQLLSTIQVGITLIGILNGAFGGAAIGAAVAEGLRLIPALAPYSTAVGIGLVVALITYCSLVVGELVPKRLALNDPERVAVLVAVPMRALSTLAAPIVRLLSASNDLVLRLLGARPSAETPVTEEEIKILIEQGTEAGVFHTAEQEIVESVFKLGDQRVDALMTPRTEIVWLDLAHPFEEARRTIVECNHSRFPVGKGSLDTIVGIAQAKTILAHGLSDEPFTLEACLDGPVFVPETVPAFKLLETFKQSGVQMVLVIDEYGGLQGLVTPSDVLQAIVGDIPSPQELAEPPAVRRDDGSWLLDGMLPTDDLEEILGLDPLPREHAGDYRTVGGFLMAQLIRVPTVGDRVEWGGMRFEVVDMDGKRVDKVLATPLRSGGREAADGARPGDDPTSAEGSAR